jgi:hypothetical protein
VRYRRIFKEPLHAPARTAILAEFDMKENTNCREMRDMRDFLDVFPNERGDLQWGTLPTGRVAACVCGSIADP